MKNTWWEKLQKDYQYFSTPSLEIIAGFILAKKVESIFEGACGSGYFPTLLRQLGYQGKYLGSDYADIFLEAAKEHNPSEEFIEVDLTKNISLDNKTYDTALVNHGLESVYPYKHTFEELKRITRRFIIINTWVTLVDINNNIRWEENKGMVNTYNKAEWYQTLKDVGLNIYLDAEIRDDKNRYNHLFILTI